MQIYIINPDTNKPVSIDDWRKEDDPTRAQLLAIETEDGHLLCMSKSYLPGEHTFEDAQKACAAFHPLESITFRAPSRKECIDIYDARFQGLDDAIKLTGGDYARRDRYHWTGDRDTDPIFAYSAGCSGAGISFVYESIMGYSYLALPVAAIAGSERMAGIKKEDTKYIDSEKLIAEIDRRLKILEPHKDTFESCAACRQELIWMKEHIASLQQEQPKGNLEYWLEHFGMPKENIDNCITQIAQGYGACRYLEGIQHGAEAVNELAKQEQPEVDLENYLENYFKGWHIEEEIGLTKPDGWSCIVVDIKDVARHFYELGLKVRKEV